MLNRLLDPLRFATLSLALVAAMSGAQAVASAQQLLPQDAGRQPARAVPDLKRVGVDEHLGAQLPLDLTFTDQTGKTVRLGDYFDGERPVFLTFAYHRCKTLCGMVLGAVEKVAELQPWTMGKEYTSLTISFDPSDTPAMAAETRKKMLAKYGRYEGDGGWNFLTGDEASIEKVTKAVGFRYFYDEVEQQFAHPAVYMLVSPDGKIVRYLYGLELKSNDVRIGLLDASHGKQVSTVDRILLYCYCYNPATHGYALVGWRVMQVGAGLTLLFLGVFFFIMWRGERWRARRARADIEGDPSPSHTHS